MTISEQILSYHKELNAPNNIPEDILVMNPYSSEYTFAIVKTFYDKYYSDQNQRNICFGINPGRFGAGITGIPFTDPIRLDKICGISNRFEKRSELSSKFIYEMIRTFGGPNKFYGQYYISAVSPLGFVRNGINLNYYDIPGFKPLFEDYVVAEIKKQLKFNINRKVAYSIGKGKNVDYLKYINEKYGFFEEIIPLSHPRWVMQYRLKRKDEFIKEYLTAFSYS